MKTIDDLTPEIRENIQKYKDLCINDLYSGKEYSNFDRKKTTEYIEKIYSIIKRDKPVIIIANNPNDYKKKFAMLQNEKVQEIVYKIYLKKNNKGNDQINLDVLKNIDINYDIETKSHYLFLCSTYHRVYLMWYKFIQDEFKISHKNEEILNWLYDNSKNNISRCYFTQTYVLVLRMPKYIRRNKIGFHSIDSPAIEWENYGMYYINGRKLPENIFKKIINKEYTFDEFIQLKNEDIKASIISLITEKFGDNELMKFLDAKIIDEVTINHSSGYSEIIKLWNTNEKFSFLSDINGNSNQPYCWLELKCPSTGSTYLISTSGHFKSAIDACKFHRPKEIPMELKYDFNSFNN
jgi:hypothetical protein